MPYLSGFRGIFASALIRPRIHASIARTWQPFGHGYSRIWNLCGGQMGEWLAVALPLNQVRDSMVDTAGETRDQTFHELYVGTRCF
jgi:hypothetical protein